MTFEPTSEPSPDLPPDRLPTADDLPSDPAPPSFDAPPPGDFATNDAAAPLDASNPTQEPSAFAPPPHDAPDSGLPLSPADAARDNARGGHWAMSEWYDGWVFLGGDGRPVVRNDGSRIGFRFADAARLAQEFADAPEQEADGSGRRVLAPLDARFNKDWDPQRPKSTLADMTKWTRLLAYHLVQSTEPEEAVRRAVSMIFGNPVTMDARGEKLWVPTKYDAEAVKSVASAMRQQILEGEQEDVPDPGSQSQRVVIYQVDDIGGGRSAIPGVIPVKNLLMKNGVRVEANPRREVAGAVGGYNPRAEHYPLHFHVHMKGDGPEGVRFLSNTFELYPGDEKLVTRKHLDFIRELDEAERWWLKRATREVFYDGRPTQKSLEGFTQRKVGVRARDAGKI